MNTKGLDLKLLKMLFKINICNNKRLINCPNWPKLCPRNIKMQKLSGKVSAKIKGWNWTQLPLSLIKLDRVWSLIKALLLPGDLVLRKLGSWKVRNRSCQLWKRLKKLEVYFCTKKKHKQKNKSVTILSTPQCQILNNNKRNKQQVDQNLKES